MKIRVLLAVVAGLGLAGCVAPVRVTSAPSLLESCGCKDIFAGFHDRVFFGFGSAALRKSAQATLVSQAAWMVKYPSVNVLVAGNADERGTETYNLALGNSRADAARDYLVAQGVASTRISTISYGKDCPVAAGHDDSSWQQNRNAITSVVGFNPQSCK